mmetsp:Transcript_31217/g.61608  ORF Transcript_31217/g.61608 Transcript_31217/m.61608 type:complete len:259 (+) Transcript_31217:3174-3950(+)
MGSCMHACRFLDCKRVRASMTAPLFFFFRRNRVFPPLLSFYSHPLVRSLSSLFLPPFSLSLDGRAGCPCLRACVSCSTAWIDTRRISGLQIAWEGSFCKERRKGGKESLGGRQGGARIWMMDGILRASVCVCVFVYSCTCLLYSGGSFVCRQNKVRHEERRGEIFLSIVRSAVRRKKTHRKSKTTRIETKRRKKRDQQIYPCRNHLGETGSRLCLKKTKEPLSLSPSPPHPAGASLLPLHSPGSDEVNEQVLKLLLPF